MSKPTPVLEPAHARLLACALSVLLPACRAESGDDDDASATADSADTGGSDTGDTGDVAQSPILVGSFQLELVSPVAASGGTPATPGNTTLFGKVYDGPTPSQIVWEEGLKDGDCQLMTPRVPFCETPCGGRAVCVEDDTCEPYPLAGGLGTVTVTGVETADGKTEFTIDPIANGYQPSGGVSLAYPAFAEGDAIAVAASGATFEAFTLRAKGIAPLVLTSQTLTLAGDTPLALTWTAPATAGASKIHVKLDISHHGGTKGMIACDTADSGALTISAALVKQLLDLGVAGFPSVIVTRSAVGSAAVAAGRVGLLVSSHLGRSVDIAGLTSCTDDSQCPDGQTCQSDLTCQ